MAEDRVTEESWIGPPEKPAEIRRAMQEFFDQCASVPERWGPRGYHWLLIKYYRYYVPKGARVLEIGCGTGDLLVALEPRLGVGVDLSPEMIRAATRKYSQPHLRFVAQAAEELDLGEEPFDYIVLSDTLSFLSDILGVFRALRPYCHERTRIICNYHSRLWQPILQLLEALRLKSRGPLINWVAPEDVRNLLKLAGFEPITHARRILLPLRIPILGTLLNRCLAPMPLVGALCLTNWTVARVPRPLPDSFGVSVICPCRNEEGNIPEIVRRLPRFKGPSELVFVEGHSEDSTLIRCREVVAMCPEKDISVCQQTGKGKGDAVRLGFSKAKYEIVLILDADMTVAPEDLPGFVDVLLEGNAEFVNGSRMVYPMENRAMRFLNLVANKFFAKAFSFLLSQPIKDTLCGTKVLLKSDYERLAAQRAYFGDFDPFGDFDLIFGAAKLSLRIADYPVRYHARIYGVTQISRFRHGWLLLRMCFVALWKLKMP